MARVQGPPKLTPVEDKLKKLATKASEWYTLDAAKKLKYLENAQEAINTQENMTLLAESAQAYTAELRHTHDQEREFYEGFDVISTLVVSKPIIDAYAEAYRMKTGTSKHTQILSDLEKRVVNYGHSGSGDNGKEEEEKVVVAKVFPLLPDEKTGLMGTAVGEAYFSPQHVPTEAEVKPWSFNELQCSTPGVCAVLGAGNYPALGLSDTLHQMFSHNQVVFLKQHPMRPSFEPIMRFLFQSLYDDGFLDSEVHVDRERAGQIVHSPHISIVHMTGGKATHDVLVWGDTKEEQEKRRASNDPKLKAHMSSELGAVTPVIVTPAQYTAKELDMQAQVVVTAKWSNGGASCNAPQVVVMSDQWPQRDQFVARIEHHWKNMFCPNVYYPGSSERVQAFQSHYDNRTTNSTITATTASWMGMMPPNSNDTHMPLLTIHLGNIDVSTDAGKEEAKEEYALQNESFGPVLVFATLKASDNENNTDMVVTKAKPSSVAVENFMDRTVMFCNDCVFGTLSCSIVVPDWAQNQVYTERSIAALQYGGVSLNSWSALCYLVHSGVWGGFEAVEKIEQVESGIGRVHNSMYLQHVSKFVVRVPILDEKVNVSATKPRVLMIRLYKALPAFVLNPNVKNTLGVLAAMTIGLLEATLGSALYWIPVGLTALTGVWIAFQDRLNNRP